VKEFQEEFASTKQQRTKRLRKEDEGEGTSSNSTDKTISRVLALQKDLICVKPNENTDKIIPSVAVASLVLLKQRNCHMSGKAYVIGLNPVQSR